MPRSSSTRSRRSADPRRAAPAPLGLVTLVLGVAALASTGFLWLLSTTDVVDPANWVRAVGLLGIPVGMVGSFVVGMTAGAKRGRGRTLAFAGMALAAVALVLFVILMWTAG